MALLKIHAFAWIFLVITSLFATVPFGVISYAAFYADRFFVGFGYPSLNR